MVTNKSLIGAGSKVDTEAGLRARKGVMQTPPHTPTKSKQLQQRGKRPRPSDGADDDVAGDRDRRNVDSGVDSGSSTASLPPITPKRPKTAKKTSNKTPAG